MKKKKKNMKEDSSALDDIYSSRLSISLSISLRGGTSRNQARDTRRVPVPGSGETCDIRFIKDNPRRRTVLYNILDL